MKKLITSILVLTILFSCKKESGTMSTGADIDTLKVVEKQMDTMQVSKSPVKKYRSVLKAELTAKGFKTYDYVDEKTNDTILMQQYFMAFLKAGPIRSQNEEDAEILQQEHLDHLTKMYELGYADISGPFGDEGKMRGVTIYNVPTLQMADSLAKSDPMVKAGRLVIEIHPWWAVKGLPLR